MALTDWQFELVAGPYGSVTEGPAWDGDALYFTHIPASRIMRFDPVSGECVTFRTDTGGTNGLAFDARGRLYGCAGGRHAIVRFEPDGSLTELPNILDGKRHNRPNDLVIDRLGRIWFTDPFGRGSDPGERELDHTSVLRLDPGPDGGWQLHRMTHETFPPELTLGTSPNGILLSPDERTLYVAVGGYLAPARELRAYPLQDDDTLGTYRVLHTFGRDGVSPSQRASAIENRADFIRSFGEAALGTHAGVDGMCLDSDGNIIAAAGWREAGPGPMIYVVSPTGRVLETHPFPGDIPTNCAFGDADLGTLYVTGGEGVLYRVRNTGRRGRPLYPSSRGLNLGPTAS